MTNKVLNNSVLSSEKLKATLNALSLRLQNRTALSEVLGESLAAFKQFYQEIGEPEFSPHYLETGDNPRSEVYNLNLRQLDADISRFYKEVRTLADAQLRSFNYAKIVNEEITKRADQLASTVLDLTILSDFTRGDVIVAGDDFRTLDNVDMKAASGAPKAEKMFGAGGMALKRKDNRSLTSQNSEVEILPLSPAQAGGEVSDKPTPGNLQRFYEGNYYNFIGSARPEGGKFNLKFMMRPQEKKKAGSGSSTHSKMVERLKDGTLSSIEDDSSQYSNKNAGFFVEVGASDEQRATARRRMFDDDPSSFWEAEYVYHIPDPLIDNLLDNAAIESTSGNESMHQGKEHTDNLFKTASVIINYKAAEEAARKWDYQGRDLIIDLVITLPQQTNVNYCVLDPILFGAKAFLEVLAIHTADSEEGQFHLVDGWDSSKYAKTINPEANEFLNDKQVGQLLSPSRYEYTGKGVFPFPSRLAKKVRIRLKMDYPVSAVYERYYTLLRHQVELETEVKTTVTKGRLRF